MSKENRNIITKVESKKWLSVVGFLISVTLLSIAVFLSINQEKMDRMAKSREYDVSNYTLSTSSEINSGINEILSNNVNNTAKIILNEVNENITVNTNTITDNSAVQQDNDDNQQNKIVEDNEEKVQENKESQEHETEQAQEQTPNEEPPKQFIMPINGEIYKEYSMDSLVYSDTLQEWVTHRGIDIQANLEEDVKASADGTVKSIKNDPRYGWSITIEHKDGFNTIYTCLKSVDMVKEGDNVAQGQVIAKVGNSGVFESADGSHLHFEMTKEGGFINPEMYIK